MSIDIFASRISIPWSLNPYTDACQIAIHVSHLSRKMHDIPGALRSARIRCDGVIRPAHVCLSAGGPCSLQDRTSICCLKLRRAVAED